MRTNRHLLLALASLLPLRLLLASPLELKVEDTQRHRTLPILVYLPPTESARSAPVVLFSHGLGGSRHHSAYLGQHWSSHGYICVFLQHPGSDEQVWKDAGMGAALDSLRQAASLQNFLDRNRDVTVVLDHLEIWANQPGHPLSGRLDLEKIGMSGHSFGAVTTQAVMGQQTVLGEARFREARIDAAIAFSPSPPQVGSPDRAFASVRIPVLLMTGTLDGDPIRKQMEPADRQKVYAALPPGDKFQLVFEGGRHSAFSDRTLRLEPERDGRIHPAILAITTAFWDAYLLGKEDAKTWLRSEAVRRLLIEADVWQWK